MAQGSSLRQGFGWKAGLRAQGREQGAGSREQGAGSREQGAGSRERRAESREQGAESGEQGAGSGAPAFAKASAGKAGLRARILTSYF
ncbi:MAG: hypothetical protein R6W81_14975 [Bacteroidales bacterium]